jgi:hypothetical protein
MIIAIALAIVAFGIWIGYLQWHRGRERALDAEHRLHARKRVRRRGHGEGDGSGSRRHQPQKGRMDCTISEARRVCQSMHLC